MEIGECHCQNEGKRGGKTKAFFVELATWGRDIPCDEVKNIIYILFIVFIRMISV
jgi:hypothetical protein